MTRTSHVKNAHRILSRLVPFTQASGKAVSETAREFKFGLTEPATTENGEKTELTAKEHSLTLTAMFTMDFGQMTKPTDRAFTNM